MGFDIVVRWDARASGVNPTKVALGRRVALLSGQQIPLYCLDVVPRNAPDGEYIAMSIHPKTYQKPHPPVWFISNAPYTCD